MEEYYYKQLSKAEGGIYYAIYKGLLNLESEFLIPSCDNQTLYNIFFRLRLDHPEIFWAKSYKCKYYRESNHYIFIPEYLFSKDKIKTHQAQMTARVKKITQGLNAKSMSDFEKEEYVHNFICENVTYDKLKKAYSHEIIGPLGHGVGVCEGIAKSVKILLDACGVWNIITLCDNNPEKGIKYRHVWNIVKIDGHYYHLDVTFDNTLSAASSEVRYDYFNLSDKQVFRDHEPIIVPAPKCETGDHFYYKEKKLSFTKLEDVYKRSLQAAKRARLSPLTVDVATLPKTLLRTYLIR